MVGHGWLYTNGSLFIRRKAARSTRSQTTCTYALQATHERVSPQLYCSPSKSLHIMFRFYPGLAVPHLPSISAGSQEPNDQIDAPDGFFENTSNQWENTEDARAGPGRSRLPSPSRATRVIGSFEHPILPMPPVSAYKYTGPTIENSAYYSAKQIFQLWTSFLATLLRYVRHWL